MGGRLSWAARYVNGCVRMSAVRRRERRRREAAREDGPGVWEVVAEFASPDGNNDAAVRQIMRDHSNSGSRLSKT